MVTLEFLMQRSISGTNMIDIDESAVDITFNPPVESTFAQPKTADLTNGISCGASFVENQTVDETVLDKTAAISEDETGE